MRHLVKGGNIAASLLGLLAVALIALIGLYPQSLLWLERLGT